MQPISGNLTSAKWPFLGAPGRAAQICQEIDWSQSPLGPIETWDPALCTSLGTMLRSAFPTVITWGTERVFFYNDAYTPILGEKHKYAMGESFHVLWKEIWPTVGPIVEGVERGKAQFFENLKMTVERGPVPEEVYFTFAYSPLLDSAGLIQGLHCVCMETTDAVRTNDELNAATREIGDILENTNDGFFAVDKNWLITRVNTNHEIFSEKKRDEQIGKSLLELFFAAPEYRESQYWKSYHLAMEKRIPVVFEDYYPPIDLWTSVSVYPQPDGGLAVFFRKVNEEKRVQLELTRAKEEAEHANQLKSAFLANMSHEIRTPLGAMMGFADLLRDPKISTSEKSNYIDILHKNGEQLSHVINDILDLSKVETGHINFEYLKVRPQQIVQEVVSLMSVIAKEKGLALAIVDDGTAPSELVSDPTRMKQVLMNLVSNALKFTKVGMITVRISGFDGDGGRNCCAFEVTDTGVGIPAETVDRLFKMFTQADNSMTRKYGGTGLGLALSRSLARAMGGDVKLVQSERDRGSTFRFSVESREQMFVRDEHESGVAIASAVDPKPAENALEGLRILLVEDSPDNQQLIWRYLSKYGADIDIADNGLEGMNKALASEHDVVLMDLQMPVMDGYTATGKLRGKGYVKPIIALTAHAMADVRKKCHDVGCNEHLPKPINPYDLVRTIARLAEPGRAH